MSEVVLAVDVGGTTIGAGLVLADGGLVHSSEAATVHTTLGRDPGLRQLRAVVGRLVRDATERGDVVRAVSLGCPEYAIGDRLTSAEVLAWDRQPGDLVRQDVEVPVFVDADVRCAALAEARLAAPHERDLFYVSWGTGISAALVVDGRCRAGRRGEALALGEFDVPATVDPTWTANLEAFASGHGIACRYEGARPGSGCDGRAVADLAGSGDRQAARIVETAARAVASAVRSCVAILDPDVVVLGGGIGSGDGLLVGTMRRELDRLLTRPDPPAIRPARAGANAGVIGAGLAGWQRLGAAR